MSSTHSWLPTQDITDTGGCVWESFLSPQKNPSIVTGPMVRRVCHQGFRGRGCKTCPSGLALHGRAFITSFYALSQQPARVAPAPLRPKRVSMILLVQNMPMCLSLLPEHICWAHFFLYILLIISPEMPQSVVTGGQTPSVSLLLRHLDDEHIFRIVLSYRQVWV